MQPERFAAGLTPLPTAARVTRQRGSLRWRIISTVISLVVLAVVIALFGRDWPIGWTVTVIVLWVLSSAFWFAVSVIGLRNAKRDLARIPSGVAFYLDPTGVEFVHPTAVAVSWADVTALKLVGRNLGAGPSVCLEARGEEVARIPVSFLDATPAVIDSAAQAYSLGRIRLDTAALDSVL